MTYSLCTISACLPTSFALPTVIAELSESADAYMRSRSSVGSFRNGLSLFEVILEKFESCCTTYGEVRGVLTPVDADDVDCWL